MSDGFPEDLIAELEASGEACEVEALFYRFLIGDATPEDWHRFAMDANWDSHDPRVYEWIASQPNCEKATALLFFWKSQPDFELEHPDAFGAFTRPEHPLIGLIRDRWKRGFYTASNLAFVFEEDLWEPDFARLDEEHLEESMRFMPIGMRGPIDGKRLDTSGLIEGIPSRFWPEDLR